MLVSLSRGRTARGDAVDLLLECHARIRSFIALASACATARDEETRAAAGQVARYFTEALPLHARDEEESVAPRLRGRDAALDAALDAMCAEHADHRAALEVLRALCDTLVARPDDAVARARIAAHAEALRETFERHLDGEERAVFPALRERLDADALEALAAEMRARRD